MLKKYLIPLFLTFAPFLFSEEESDIESNKSLLEDGLFPNDSSLKEPAEPLKDKWKESTEFDASVVEDSWISIEPSPCLPDSSSSFQRTFLTFRHREANGIGYSPGYSTIELFYLPESNSNWFGLIDFAAHIFNNGKWGANIGTGVRRFFDSASFSAGLNIYWDWKQSQHTQFQQMSLGLDLLFSNWGLYTNVYAPLTQHKKAIQTKFSHFQGHSAIFSKKYELDPWGVDLGATYSIYRSKSFSSEAALTGYFFQGDYNKKIYGALGRVQLKLQNILMIEGQLSYDNHFKFIPQVEVVLSLPLGSSKASSRNYCTNWYAQKPNRFEIPVTFSHKEESEAYHPLTGDPLTFYFIDSSRPVATPDGSFKNPFVNLAAAEAASNKGDVLYVFPGFSTYGGGISLKDNQILAGSGASLPLLTTFGPFSIPPQSNTLPLVTSVGNQSIIKLANSTLISGLELTSTSLGSPIVGGIITNFSLLNSILVTTQSNNIVFTEFGGTLLLEGNSITGNSQNLTIGTVAPLPTETTIIFQNNSFSSVTASPVVIDSSFTGEVTIRDNFFHMIASSSLSFIQISDTFNGNVTLQDNVFSKDSGQAAMVFSASSLIGNLLFERNTSFLGSALFTFTSSNINPYATLIRGNNLNGTSSPFCTTDVESLGLSNHIVQNNLISTFGSAGNAALVFEQSNNGLTFLRLTKNKVVSPGNSEDSLVKSLGGLFLFLQSPNLQLSGVQEMNQGVVSTSSVTFVFFE